MELSIAAGHGAGHGVRHTSVFHISIKEYKLTIILFMSEMFLVSQFSLNFYDIIS